MTVGIFYCSKSVEPVLGLVVTGLPVGIFYCSNRRGIINRAVKGCEFH